MSASTNDIYLIQRRYAAVQRAFANRVKELCDKGKQGKLSEHEKNELRWLWGTMKHTLNNLGDAWNHFVTALVSDIEKAKDDEAGEGTES